MVSFTQAIRTCFVTKIFNWHDRAPRSEYWWFVLFVILASIGLGLLVSAIGIELGVWLIIAFFLYTFWAGLMVGIRRLHDKNMRGWWLLLWFAVQFVCSVVNQMMLYSSYYNSNATMVMGVVGLISFVVQIIFIVIFASRGTVGPNRFGPDPLLP